MMQAPVLYGNINNNDRHLVEIQVGSEELLQGHFLQVRRDTVRLPDGRHSPREYVIHPGAVMIVAQLDDGRLVLERQYRYPVQAVMIEFPAGKLDAGEAGRYVNQLRYFQKKVEQNLDAAGLKLVNVEGHVFDPGMAASPLNIEDFGPEEALLVDQMVEPIIMGPDGLKKQGTVMLRKVKT